MIISLDEAKSYLRLDSNDEDDYINRLIASAESLCMDVDRIDAATFAEHENIAMTSVLYATAYLYEHREEADHHDLVITLRSLLFGIRKEGF